MVPSDHPWTAEVMVQASAPEHGHRLEALARPGGAFGMLAIDQRETLRAMLADVLPAPVPDEVLVRFKVEAVRALTPAASAVLVDPAYALDAVLAQQVLAPGCGLIVAADRFDQAPGQAVEQTWLEDGAAERAVDAGAAALKLLVIWRRGEEQDHRSRIVGAFLDAASRAGLLAIVEGVVRAPSGVPPLAGAALDDAILDCARELCAFGPDLYKGEVPTLGAGDDATITGLARQLTTVVGPRPWVVLSAGVPAARFEDAVAAACRGGASGFLAGRGIWRAALDPAARDAAFRDVALPRLLRLGAIVDRDARPWREAVAG